MNEPLGRFSCRISGRKVVEVQVLSSAFAVGKICDEFRQPDRHKTAGLFA